MKAVANPPEVQSRVLLATARDALAQPSLHATLFASLCLRLGIEARLHEYLDAYENVARLRKREWQLTKLENQVNKAFRTGERTLRLTITDAKNGASLGNYWYTPVTPRLRKFREKLGDSLHFAGAKKLAESGVTEFRAFLQDIIEELEFATSGTMTGPPVTDPDKNSTTFSIEGDLTSILSSGRKIAWKIDILEIEPPTRHAERITPKPERPSDA